MKDFPASSMVKNLPSNAGDASLLPGQGTWEPTYLSTAAKRGPDTAMKTQYRQKREGNKADSCIHILQWNPHTYFLPSSPAQFWMPRSQNKTERGNQAPRTGFVSILKSCYALSVSLNKNSLLNLTLKLENDSAPV